MEGVGVRETEVAKGGMRRDEAQVREGCTKSRQRREGEREKEVKRERERERGKSYEGEDVLDRRKGTGIQEIRRKRG